MAPRTYGYFNALPALMFPPQTKPVRVWLWVKPHATALTTSYIKLIVSMRMTLPDGHDGPFLVRALL